MPKRPATTIRGRVPGYVPKAVTDSKIARKIKRNLLAPNPKRLLNPSRAVMKSVAQKAYQRRMVAMGASPYGAGGIKYNASPYKFAATTYDVDGQPLGSNSMRPLVAALGALMDVDETEANVDEPANVNQNNLQQVGQNGQEGAMPPGQEQELTNTSSMQAIANDSDLLDLHSDEARRWRIAQYNDESHRNPQAHTQNDDLAMLYPGNSFATSRDPAHTHSAEALPNPYTVGPDDTLIPFPPNATEYDYRHGATGFAPPHEGYLPAIPEQDEQEEPEFDLDGQYFDRHDRIPEADREEDYGEEYDHGYEYDPYNRDNSHTSSATAPSVRDVIREMQQPADVSTDLDEEAGFANISNIARDEDASANPDASLELSGVSGGAPIEWTQEQWESWNDRQKEDAIRAKMDYEHEMQMAEQMRDAPLSRDMRPIGIGSGLNRKLSGRGFCVVREMKKALKRLGLRR